MSGVYQRLEAIFAPERIAEYLLTKLLPDMVVAALTFLGFWLLWRAARKGISVVLDRAGLDITAQRFVQTITRYLVLGIGGGEFDNLQWPHSDRLNWPHPGRVKTESDPDVGSDCLLSSQSLVGTSSAVDTPRFAS
ncbi:MAG: hypothetical protein ACI9WU_002737 [Myxococcota bacterium]|jgi:hypothetical protein